MRVSIGRIVHVQIREGVWRPAIVVNVFGDDVINVQVFGDGYQDIPELKQGVDGNVVWMTSLRRGDAINEWCWPPRVEDE